MDLFAVPVTRWYRTPVVLSSQRAHRDLTPGMTRHLLRMTDRMVDGIVVNSRAVARELAEEDGVPGSMVRLAYNGLDTSVFCREGERAALPWDDAAVVIGTVCALRPEKGLGTLMEAFRKVKGGGEGVEVGVLGSGTVVGGVEAGGLCGVEIAS